MKIPSSRNSRKKPSWIEPNIQALRLGYDYAAQHHTDCCGLNIHRRDLNGDQILMEGNAAAGLGAVYAGATVAGWYPITPSTSVVEAFEKYCQTYRVDEATGTNKFAILQAEDELAAIWHRHRRQLEWGAGVHRHLRTRGVVDE